MVWVVCHKYGSKRHIKMYRGTMLLYLSSLSIIFMTMPGFLLKFFEFPLEVISILLLSGSSIVYFSGQPFKRICFMWAGSSGDMWSLITGKVFWHHGNDQYILLLGNVHIIQGHNQNGSLLHSPSWLKICQCALAVYNYISTLVVGRSQYTAISILLVSC